MAAAPFPTGEKALCVAYYASAEMDCFHALGWPHPVHVLDFFTEFRCLTNGLRLSHGSGLLGALHHYGLPSIGAEQKDIMRDLVLTGGPWNESDQLAILDYSETDVVALAHLLTAMQEQIDWPRALLRGRYMKAVSCIQTNGIPIDTAALALLQAQWSAIQDQLIADVDIDYGIFEGRIRQLTRRSGGRSMEQVVQKLRPYLLGWKAYFGMAQTPRVWLGLDEWLRHRLVTILRRAMRVCDLHTRRENKQWEETISQTALLDDFKAINILESIIINQISRSFRHVTNHAVSGRCHTGIGRSGRQGAWFIKKPVGDGHYSQIRRP
jgi:hypothetical protein